MAIYKRRNLGDSLAGFMLKERNIYGSSMIGTSYDTLEMIGAHLDTVNALHHLGNKNFFLENHLGNVLATVSDKKIPRFINGILDHYEADIISSTDYYGFGQEEEGRNFNSKASRYGFNGKMKDNEVEGEGDVYDYGMRIYDARLGRFMSVDPLSKKYPYLSPFAFAENDVIRSIDLDGLEKYIITLSNDYKGKTTSFLSINPNIKEWDKGLYKYKGEDKIFSVKEGFQRPEEVMAQQTLDALRAKDKNGKTTMGVSFEYKLDVKFKTNKAEISNKDEIKDGLNWVGDRLANNPDLKLTITSNIGLTQNDDITPAPVTPQDNTPQDITLMQNRSNSIKKEIEKTSSNSKLQIEAKPGKVLSGKENRKASLNFQEKKK